MASDLTNADFPLWLHPRQMADLVEMARVEDARTQTFRGHAERRAKRKAERAAKWAAKEGRC